MIYEGRFVINFTEYCKANNLEVPPTDMIEKWKEDTVKKYEKDIPVSVVMSLFQIPDTYKNKIEHRDYKVECSSTTVDKDQQQLYLDMLLTLNK